LDEARLDRRGDDRGAVCRHGVQPAGDSAIDARNPRTKTRHLPAGLLSRSFACGFVIASSGVLFLAAWALNPLCLRLAPLALGIVLFYSFTKRFTPSRTSCSGSA
jgi:4-hydroxybenzoate polyprenyltransferase